MKTKSLLVSLLAFIMVFALAFYLGGRSFNSERYPLENEVDSIASEFYLFYLANGRYPEDKSFLGSRSSNLIAAYPERFQWDSEKVFLHFNSAVPDAFAPATIGKPGEAFVHNSRIYKAHAAWAEGYWRDYEASEEELKKAGVSF